MRRALAIGLVVIALGAPAAAHADPDPGPTADPPPVKAPTDSPTIEEPGTEGDDQPGWWRGDHATGEWGGARKQLDDHGVQLDVVYASDVFTARGHLAALGHVDAALTLDTDKLVGWPGGTIYVLGQNNHGDVINDVDHIGSAVGVTNLEAEPYTQLTELFVEQTGWDGKLRVRIGKQDANRDFGTPRFAGNFINNNFGMFPNSPLPSYPTTGLGAIVIAQPTDWLLAKAGVYEASPEVGGLGLTTAFADGAGYVAAASVGVTHHYGANGRDGGTTSVGAWWQSDDEDGADLVEPDRFHRNAGAFVQDDERVYLHPEDAKDPRGLTVIVRYSYARADRSRFPHYAGGSAAWHGIGARRNDTAGIGATYFTIAEANAVSGSGPNPGQAGAGKTDEWSLEAFYKLRLTSFVSFQPDAQWFRHPGGASRDALVGGVRFKVKL